MAYMKNKLKDIKYVYHGTNEKYLKELQNIWIPKGKPKKDFGQGFYTTTDELQASRWALNKSTEKYKPVVIKYELLYEKIDFNITNNHIFLTPCDKWAKFIFENRKGLHEPNKFDFIYGKVADGKMAEIHKLLDENSITFEEFSKRIKPSKEMIDQLYFGTEYAIKCLKYIGVV
jgi:hypothetical protein